MNAPLRTVAALAVAATSTVVLASDLPAVEAGTSNDPTPITSVDVDRAATVLPEITVTADIDRAPMGSATQSGSGLSSRQSDQWIQPLNPGGKIFGGGSGTPSPRPYTSVVPVPAAAGLAVIGLAGVVVGRRRLGQNLRG